MRKPVSKIKIAIVSILALFGTYVWADTWDLIPGILTLQAPENAPQPYPSVSSGLLVDDTQTEEWKPPVESAAAPLPEKQKIQNALDELSAKVERLGVVSAIVADIPSGEILAEKNSSRSAVPASVNKLLTATAALNAFGANHTFQTETKFHDGTVYLIGGGDVLLAADKGDGKRVIGHSGLGDLAQKTAEALQKNNIKSVNLAVDGSLFAPQAYAPSTDLGIGNWVMEAAPIAVNRNLNAQEKFIGNPKQQAVEIFAKHLIAAGINTEIIREKQTPEAAQQLAAVKSAPIRDLVDLTLLESDNTLAETLAHAVAAKKGKTADYAGAAAAVEAELAQLGFSLEGTKLADGSGLSEANRITPILINQIVQRIGKCTEESCASLLSALPVAKLDGTLEDRFKGFDLGGRVRAKTGSLDSVTSMAGLLYTNAGRELSFVLIIDNVPNGGAYSMRPLIDATIAEIAAG